MALLLEMLDVQLADPAIDLKRIYVTGISMGGYGTWDLISRRPDVFAAALPICGGGDVAQAAKIAKIPLWTFHGSADGAVPVCRSRNMVSALWANGSNAHYREYPDAGHAVWVETYKDKRVLAWFFKQKKK
jgi:predicted peptidase